MSKAKSISEASAAKWAKHYNLLQEEKCERLKMNLEEINKEEQILRSKQLKQRDYIKALLYQLTQLKDPSPKSPIKKKTTKESPPKTKVISRVRPQNRFNKMKTKINAIYKEFEKSIGFESWKGKPISLIENLDDNEFKTFELHCPDCGEAFIIKDDISEEKPFFFFRRHLLRFHRKEVTARKNSKSNSDKIDQRPFKVML